MDRKQDFTTAVIYHIRRIDTKMVIYVGSTTDFKQRQRSHKNVCYNSNNKMKYNYPIYCYIRENGGFDCFEVIPVSFLKLENKVELLIEEQKEIDKFDELFNKYHSFPTTQHKKDLKTVHDSQYRERHDEEIKAHKKKYYEEHKEEIKAKVKTWAENNKEKLFEPLECPRCKTMTSKKHIKRHQKSQKCRDLYLLE